MPDTHDTARTTADASAPLLSFPDALTSEAAAMLLGGDVGGLKAVQEKLAAALAGQGVSGTDAGRLADGWVQSFASGVGAAGSPDAAIAEASRITAGVAARMAQAVQDAAGLTGEQRLATALAQGQNVTQTIAQGTATQGTATQGAADGKAPANLATALFDGVMDQLARPAGSADPMAALSQALNNPPPAGPAAATVDLSPAEKLTAALASGVAVPDAVKTLGADGAGLFAETLERALSNGENTASAVAAATERAAQGGAQAQSVAVEQSGGDRLMTALAAGGADALRGAGATGGQGAAFANVLNDALARGTTPDAALGASAKAQAEMAAQESAAGVAPKPADALVASLASGRNVTETVKSFAAAAGLDAAGGFGHALGTALSSGQEAAGALGAARQDVAAASAMAAESARGVKGDGLVSALASGQNVQSAVQAVGGGGGAFSDALGRALAEGRSPGQALATARQAADIAQQNSQASEVPVSPENQALANLAAPASAEAPADGEKAHGADAKGDGKAAAEGAKAEAATQVADSGEKTDGEKEGEKDAGKDEAKDGKEAGDKAADAPAAASSSSSESGSPQDSAPASKSADMAGPAMKAVSFAAPDGGAKSTASGDSAGQAPAASNGQPASTAPVTKTATATADAFAVTAQTQQRVVQSVTQATEGTTSDGGTAPETTPTVPVAHHALAPTLASGFDAAALAKALAMAEGTTAPAGFTVFHLIEAMFRAGETGSSVVGVAVVANGASALGVWQYSTDGATWQAVGTVSDASALILPGSALLRFLPAAGASGAAPALGLRAVNDEWTGGFGTLAALTGTGGTSPLSAEVGQLSLEVTPVNGAPVATGATATLAAIAEDSASPAGASVSSLFAALFSDPTDAVFGAAGDGLAGVAVTANAATAAQGEWQYWNGSAWTAIGAVSAGSALLLSADAKLRFLPAADWNGTTPALTVRLVDDSEGAIASGGRVSLEGGTGGTTRYSAETIALTGSVTPVNDAPVATGTTATLAAVAEDTVNPAGATVSSLFGSLFSDPKDALGGSGADELFGVVIVGGTSTPSQGVWQYWNGSAWTAIGAVSEDNALVVRAIDKLRFLPAADWNGTPPSLTVRLIDSSATLGGSGTRIDLGSLGVGGTTPYSATTITLDSRVTAVNDAPVATGTAVTLATIAEDAANPAGATVAALFGGLFSDPADTVTGGSTANGFAGVAVVANAATSAQGLWQYWTGSAWADVGAASDGSALLLAADAKLRFLPAADWNGTTPALTVRLVDDSEGTLASGARTALSGSGGSTRYSADTIALTGAVTAVNDAPVATAATASLPAIAEDTADPAGATVTSLFGALFSDAADAVAGGSTANTFAGVAIVGNAATPAEGVWQYWTGSAWAAVGTVSEGSALVVAAADKLRFVPAADWNGTTPALTVRLIEQSAATVATGGHLDLTTGVGGSTAYGADTIALTGTVTPVNDAPHVAAGTASLTTIKGVEVAVTGLSVSDIDAGSTPLLVTLTAGHGTLTLDDGGLDAVITGNGTGSVTVRATLAVINSLLGATNGLLYKATSYTGADSIGILVDDQGGGGAGGPLTATASVAVTVKPPNASPVLADTDLTLSVAAGALAAPVTGTAGVAVSKLVGPGNVTDSDSGALTGIALVGANENYGHWWYSTDGGATWQLVGTVNDSDSALLLGSNDRLYFQHNAEVPYTVNAALTIRAWDQTTGTHGTKVTVDTTDGSAFSTATDSVTLRPGILIANGSFDNGLTGWTSSANGSGITGTSISATGDGHEGAVTSASGLVSGDLESFLGAGAGTIAALASGSSATGHAMKLSSTFTVTQPMKLSFDWTFIFSDPGYHDFAFVSVNETVYLITRDASGSGTMTVDIPANTPVTVGFGAADTQDNSQNPTLRVDNIKLSTVASDPIVLDMTGNGLALRSLADGVHFDVTGDGVADQTGWVGAGNALLVRDENHNGRIDDARELVSEQFGKGFNSSLEALASLDTNHDGRLDAADEAFATLQVWQDHNADGVSQTGELRTLAEAGIRSIATTSTASDATLAGNRILGTTSVTMADGSTHAAAGVAFDVKPAEAAQVQVAAQVPNQPQAQPFAGGHDGTDFAALLSSGLGLPGVAPVAVDASAFHGTEWAADAHDPNGHHPQPHDPSGVHASGNA